MQPLQKLIELASDALALYIRKTTLELGEGLPIKEAAAKEPKTRVKKTEKIEDDGIKCNPSCTYKTAQQKPNSYMCHKHAIENNAEKTAKEPESPFGSLGGAKEPEAAAASIEDQAEAKRRCQEVMGLFIRRYLKAQPTGLDRAKGILTHVCGRIIAKLEDLTHADNVKLIPVFEAELEKAA